MTRHRWIAALAALSVLAGILPAGADDFYYRYKWRGFRTGEGALTAMISGNSAGRIGTPLAAALVVSGGSGSYDFAVDGSLPPGMAPSGNGVSGTPTAAGSYPIVLSAADREHPASTVALPLTLTVAPPLSLSGPAAVAARAGAPVTAAFVPDGALGSLAWSLVGGSLPGGLALDGGGRIRGTPAAPGNASLYVRVRDAHDGATAQAPVSLTVGPALAIGGIPTLTARTGTPLAPATLTAVGGLGSLTWSASGLPTGLALSGSGALSGTPAVPAAGSFQVLLADAADGATATAQVPFTFADPPAVSLNATEFRLHVSEPAAIRPAASGILGTASWTLSAGSLPSGLTLDAATGRISGTVAGPASVAGLVLTVRDSADNATAASLPFAIAFSDEFLVADVPERLVMRIGAAPADLDSGWFTARALGAAGPVAWSLGGTLPGGSTLAIAPTGKVTGTVVTPGTFPLTVTAAATDAEGAAVSAQRSLTLEAAPALAVEALPQEEYIATTGVNFSLPTPVVTGAIGTLRYTLDGPALPPGLSLNALTGVLSGKPTKATPPAEYCIRATDLRDNATACSPPFLLSVSDPPAQPSDFRMTDVTGAALGATVNSSWVWIEANPTQQTIAVSGEGTPEIRYVRSSYISGWATSHVIAASPYQYVIQVRLKAAAKPLTPVTAAVTLGATTQPWTVTTREPDLTPDPFTIPPKLDVAPGSLVTEVFSPRNFDETLIASIEGAEGELTLNGGATWAKSVEVKAGLGVMVRARAPAEYSAETAPVVRVGPTSAAWRITTKAAAAAPDSFYIPARTNLFPGELAVSAPVAVKGAFVSLPISVSGDGAPALSVDGGSTWGTSATVASGGTFLVRATAPADYAAETVPTVRIGTMVRNWSVRTASAPTMSILNVTGAALSTLTEKAGTVTSRFPTPLTVTGEGNPEVSIDNGATWAKSVTVEAPTAIAFKVRMTSSASYLTAQAATLTLGPTVRTWSVMTRGADNVPDPFTITWGIAGAIKPATTYVSLPVKVAAFDGPLPLTAGGPGDPEVSIDNGVTWADSADIMPGQSFKLRLTTPDAYNAWNAPTVKIASTHASIIALRTHVAPYLSTAPVNVANSQLDRLYETATFNVGPTGADVPMTVSGEGDPELYTSRDGIWGKNVMATGGGTVKVRMTSSDKFSTTRTATITIPAGGATYNWTVRTRDIDTVPNSFTINWSSANRNPGDTLVSNPVTLLSFDGPLTLSTVSTLGTPVPELSIDGGATWSSSHQVMPGNTFLFRMTLPNEYQKDVQATITVGTAAPVVVTVSSRAIDTTPDPISLGSTRTKVPQGTYVDVPVLAKGFEGVLPVTIIKTGAWGDINSYPDPLVSVDGGVTWGKSATVVSGTNVTFRIFMTDNVAALGGVAHVIVAATIGNPPTAVSSTLTVKSY